MEDCQMIDILSRYDPYRVSDVQKVIMCFQSIAGDEACNGEDIDFAIAEKSIMDYIKTHNPSLLIKQIIKSYLMQCEIDRKRLNNFDDLGVYDNPSSNISLLLYLIIVNAGCLADYCLEELKQLLLGEDQGGYYLASKMLAGYSCNLFYDVEIILNIMEKWGL
ncbi:MAG: hypothetical protein ACYSUT_11890, partial [Planctomycetota bacterium]